jgi:hypothetical protein
MADVSRVGNVGSLSCFATVYLELHVSFTSAYGLTLGFVVLALFMIVIGRHLYGTKASSTHHVIGVINTSQYEFLMSAMLSLKQYRFLSAVAETALGWHTRTLNTSLSTVK